MLIASQDILPPQRQRTGALSSRFVIGRHPVKAMQRRLSGRSDVNSSMQSDFSKKNTIDILNLDMANLLHSCLPPGCAFISPSLALVYECALVMGNHASELFRCFHFPIKNAQVPGNVGRAS